MIHVRDRDACGEPRSWHEAARHARHDETIARFYEPREHSRGSGARLKFTHAIQMANQ
jgi:hypothetical protein